MIRLTSTRSTDGKTLLDHRLTYDCVGNLTRLVDNAQQDVFFANRLVSPDHDYTYDALYQLITATGREHISQGRASPDDPLQDIGPHPHDGNAMRRYSRIFQYDEVGNLRMIQHIPAASAGGSTGWTRTHSYPDDCNRLASVTTGSSAEPFSHDGSGNISAMPHLQHLAWNSRNQIERVQQGTSTAYYWYDAAGHRVRRVVEKNGGGVIEDSVFIDGYDVLRRRNALGVTTFERTRLEIGDEDHLYAVIETTTPETPIPGRAKQLLMRYQLDDHLDSTLLELDAAGRIVTHEEHYPYGGTAYQAARSALEADPGRPRFASAYRDSTGFLLLGVRYLAPWLGRWTAPDPAGMVDGSNTYPYALCNPLRNTDPTGTQTISKTPDWKDKWLAGLIERKPWIAEQAAERARRFGPPELRQHNVLQIIAREGSPEFNQVIGGGATVTINVFNRLSQHAGWSAEDRQREVSLGFQRAGASRMTADFLAEKHQQTFGQLGREVGGAAGGALGSRFIAPSTSAPWFRLRLGSSSGGSGSHIGGGGTGRSRINDVTEFPRSQEVCVPAVAAAIRNKQLPRPRGKLTTVTEIEGMSGQPPVGREPNQTQLTSVAAAVEYISGVTGTSGVKTPVFAPDAPPGTYAIFYPPPQPGLMGHVVSAIRTESGYVVIWDARVGGQALVFKPGDPPPIGLFPSGTTCYYFAPSN